MPYISDELKDTKMGGRDNFTLHSIISQLSSNLKETFKEDKINGVMTYVFFKLAKEVFVSEGTGGYDKLSDGSKCLLQAEREYDNRFIRPYEKEKRKENGDV